MKVFKFPVGLALALSMFATSVIPQNVQAHVVEDYKMELTSSEHRVMEAFDRFHYALAVEWDQKDPAFKAAAQGELEKALIDLMKAGVSASEIQKAMEKSILQGKAQGDYKRLVAAISSQDMTTEEATEMAMDFMDKNYHEGTSFAGQGHSHGKWKVIVAIIIVVVIIHTLRDRGDDDRRHHEEEEENNCHWSDRCYDNWD